MSSSNKFKWVDVSREFYEKNTQEKFVFRSEKACRERWIAHLNPHLNKFFIFFIKFHEYFL